MRASLSDPRAADRFALVLVAGWIALKPAVLAARRPGPPIPLIPHLAIEAALARGL